MPPPEIPGCHGCRRRHRKCGREPGGCGRCKAANEECVYPRVSNPTRRPEVWLDSTGRLRVASNRKLVVDQPELEKGLVAEAGISISVPKGQRSGDRPRSRKPKSSPPPAPSSPIELLHDSIVPFETDVAVGDRSTPPAVAMAWGTYPFPPNTPPKLALAFVNTLPLVNPSPLLIPIDLGLDSGTILSLVASFFKSASSWGVMRSFFQNAHGALPFNSRSLSRVFRHPFLILVVLWSGAATVACSGGLNSPLLGTAVRLREVVEDMLRKEMKLFRTSANGHFQRAISMGDKEGQNLLASLLAMQIMLRTLLVNISYTAYLQLLEMTVDALFACGAMSRVGSGTIFSVRELAVRQEWLWLIHMLAFQDMVTSNGLRPQSTQPRQAKFTMELLATLPVPLEEGLFDTVSTFGEEEPELMAQSIRGSPVPSSVDGGSPSSIEESHALSSQTVDAGSLMTGYELIGLLRDPNFGGRRIGRNPGCIDSSAFMLALSVGVGMSRKLVAACVPVGVSYLELAIMNATGVITERWKQADPTGTIIPPLIARYKEVIQTSKSLRAVLSGPELNAIDEVSDLATFLEFESQRYPADRLPLGSTLVLHIVLHVNSMSTKGGTFRGAGFPWDWTEAFAYLDFTPHVVAHIADILNHAIIAARYVAQLLDVATSEVPPSEAAVNNGMSALCVILSALGWYRNAGIDLGDAAISRRMMLGLARRGLKPTGIPITEMRRLALLQRLQAEESFGM